MEFLKNSKLLPEVCGVTIKSVYGKVNLAVFTALYATPSSINWQKTEDEKDAGILYNHSVDLLYPGLKESDFTNFHELVKDRFEVQCQFINGDVYKLNNNLYPFKLTYKFIQGKGLQLTFKGSTPLSTSFTNNVIIDGFAYTLTFTL